MNSQFEQNREKLAKSLKNSAFRRGTSAFRLGLIPQGISDHLPIEVVTDKYSLISWNMLSDTHLYNNFMNISGNTLLLAAILEDKNFSSGCIYGNATRNQMYHFFSELSQYLYSQIKSNTITVDEKTLKGFISLKSQSSLLARSRNPAAVAEKEKLTETARSRFVELLLDEKHEYAHEFKLAIRHSLELIHHIQQPTGALKWKNRFALLEQNQVMVNKLTSVDVLCLQECTNPDDVKKLLRRQNKSYEMISYKINARTTDHCVIAYDSKKFTLVAKPIFHALEGKKPCIFLTLQNIHSGEKFMVSSIHHPGGHVNKMVELMEKLNNLKKDDENIDFVMMGDFNHTEDHFLQSDSSSLDYQMIYPDSGTMAGSDYGNVNQAIDAVVTNMSKIEVKRIDGLLMVKPADTPVIVIFQQDDKVQPNARPHFFNPVASVTTSTQAKSATQALGTANINMAARQTL